MGWVGILTVGDHDEVQREPDQREKKKINRAVIQLLHITEPNGRNTASSATILTRVRPNILHDFLRRDNVQAILNCFFWNPEKTGKCPATFPGIPRPISPLPLPEKNVRWQRIMSYRAVAASMKRVLVPTGERNQTKAYERKHTTLWFIALSPCGTFLC